MADQNTRAAEARRRKRAAPPPLRELLIDLYREHEDVTGWWRDHAVLSRLGPGLAELFAGASPTVVVAPQSRGTLLGTLVAQSLGTGLVEVRKDDGPATDNDQWRYRTTPPDYRDRHLRLGFRKRLLLAGERALFVDDWIDTGGQALGTWNLVNDAGAVWVGAAVIVDGLAQAQVRRDLDVRSLLRAREL